MSTPSTSTRRRLNIRRIAPNHLVELWTYEGQKFLIKESNALGVFKINVVEADCNRHAKMLFSQWLRTNYPLPPGTKWKTLPDPKRKPE